MNRRLFLQATLTGIETAVLLGAGLLKPRAALASWPAAAFNAQSLAAALEALTGMGMMIAESDAVTLNAPAQADDGRTVPVEVISRLPGTRAIALLSEKNPFPAVARFELTAAVAPRLSARIKMGGSGKVVALVEANGRFYSTSRQVEVAAGGC